MIKILFVCHGNICRSPMAEFVMKYLVEQADCAALFEIASAATSTEEIGEPVHHGTRNILKQKLGISTTGKYARQITVSDYRHYDYLIGMDRWNIQNMLRVFRQDPEGKVRKLLDFTDQKRDVADPWYTGDFETTYRDVWAGCNALLEWILEQEQQKLYRKQ